MTTPPSHRENDLLALLRKWATDNGWKGTTKKKIQLPAVWTAFHGVRDNNPDGEYESAILARQLKSLERHRRIKLIKTDNREKIPLPVAIWLLPTTGSEPEQEEMPRWHHELYWLAYEWPNATRKQRAAYTAINSWLMRGPDLTPVPLRERSLEIFGEFGSAAEFPMPEKTLDTLKSGPLFSDPDQLLALIRAFVIPPPLLSETFLEEIGDGYYQKIGIGDVLLVIENSTTWWSIVRSLPDQHRLGYVAWGLGNTFLASIHSIAEKHGVSRIRYFGDLDLSGLRIPRAASRRATEDDLPPVAPAVELYAALQRFGRSSRGKERQVSRTEAAQLADWLVEPLREQAIELLMSGERLAQEWVGLRYLKRSDTWYPDVR